VHNKSARRIGARLAPMTFIVAINDRFEPVNRASSQSNRTPLRYSVACAPALAHEQVRRH